MLTPLSYNKGQHNFGIIETQPLFNLLITSLVWNHKFKRYTSTIQVLRMCSRSHILLSFFFDGMCIISFLTLRQNTEHYFFQMPRFCIIITHFSFMVLILRNNMYSFKGGLLAWYTAISRKVVEKNLHATIPKGNMGYEQYTVPDIVAFLYHLQTYVHGLLCHSFKFLWRTVNSKPPTIPFGIVACTFSTTFLSKRVRTTVSQSVSQTINQSSNQSINQSIN